MSINATIEYVTIKPEVGLDVAFLMVGHDGTRGSTFIKAHQSEYPEGYWPPCVGDRVEVTEPKIARVQRPRTGTEPQ